MPATLSHHLTTFEVILLATYIECTSSSSLVVQSSTLRCSGNVRHCGNWLCHIGGLRGAIVNMQSQKSILLVEDDVLIAMAERRIITGFGYEVVVAHSDKKAIEQALGNEAISLVLMDIDLGKGVDGTEVARQILAHRNLPIVFLTSHSEREMVAKVRGITRYGYVIKNSGDFVLQSSIEMAYDLWEAHEQLHKENLDRKQAETVLREREVMLNGILDNSPFGIWMQNQEGRLLFVNKAFCQAVGIPEERFLAVPHYSELYEKATAERCMLSDSQALAQATPHVSYEDLCFTDGQIHSLEIVKTRISDMENRLQGLVCVSADITERKKAEKALKESEEKYRLVAENTYDWEFWVLPDGSYKYVSPSCERITGYKAEEFLADATLLERMTHPDDYKLICTHIAEVKNGTIKIHDFDFRVIRRDGEIKWVNHHCHPVFGNDRRPLGVRGSNRDITERKRADESRERIASLAQTTLDSTVDAILVVDNQGRWVGFNERFLRMWDIPREFISSGNDDRALSHAMTLLKDPGQFISKVNELKSSPEAESMDMLELVDGRTLERYSRPQRLNGVPIGRAWSFRDITERRQAEARIQSLLREKDILLHEVHHRIKNNMTTVKSLLSMQAAAMKDQSAIAALKDARDRIQSMSLLYDKLYRSESVTEIAVGDYLSTLLDDIVANFPRHPSLSIEKHLDNFVLDARRSSSLGILVNELFTNAMKYAFGGNQHGVLAVTTSLKNKRATVTVADNGPGIPEAIDVTASPGFGLQLVEMLTEQLEGTISMERDHGTKWVLEFDI